MQRCFFPFAIFLNSYRGGTNLVIFSYFLPKVLSPPYVRVWTLAKHYNLLVTVYCVYLVLLHYIFTVIIAIFALQPDTSTSRENFSRIRMFTNLFFDRVSTGSGMCLT